MATTTTEPVILLLEGDQARRNGLVGALHAAGLRVVAATTGAQALAMFESCRESQVISGSHLRGLTGLEVLHQLREREARQRLAPIQFMLLPVEMDPLPAAALAPHAPAPLTTGEFLAAVNKLLDHPPAGSLPG